MDKNLTFNETLILEVKKHSCLWDQNSVDYSSPSLKSKQWEAVAYELESTVEDVKNCWKVLKDAFKREVKNISKNCSLQSKWMYFELMSFLLKGYNSLLLPSAFISQSLVEGNCLLNEDLATTYDPVAEYLTSMDDESDPLPLSKKSKASPIQIPCTSHLQSSTPNSKTEQTTSSHCDHASEDYYFLMSLLPTFERLPPSQKLMAKIKMMQSVYNAAYGSPTSDYYSSVDLTSNSVSSGS